MIVVIDDATFSAGITPSVTSAVQSALAAAQLGLHRVLVSPLALEIAEGTAPAPAFLFGLRIVQGGWVEGQAMAQIASRIVVLTNDPARSRLCEDNKFFVHCDDVEGSGIFREASVIMESMSTDTKWLKICMRSVLQLSPTEFRRFWHAKSEQGGGSTIFNFVNRYVDEDSNPMALVVDRDATGVPAKNSTAGKVIKALINKGLFPNKDAAHTGGYSPSVANFSTHVLNCWSIENLILPNVMDIFFEELADGIGDTSRRDSISAAFPSYPNLSNAEAEEWLKLKFKKSPLHAGLDIFNSSCIDRLANWIEADDSNYKRFSEALIEDMKRPAFDIALRSALRDFWSIGQRLKTLA